MSRAQDRLAPLVEWVKTSSASETSPLGDTIVRGPWAVFVPSALDVPPVDIAPGHLPLYLPAAPLVPGTPSHLQAEPENQGSVAPRLLHFLWMHGEGRFDVTLLALSDPYESLQSALDRQAPGLDLAETPVPFLRCWTLPADDWAYLAGKLPAVRV